MNKKFIRHLFAEFLNLGHITKTTIRKHRETNLIDYFIKIGKDLNLSFQKIKNKYERN